MKTIDDRAVIGSIWMAMSKFPRPINWLVQVCSIGSTGKTGIDAIGIKLVEDTEPPKKYPFSGSQLPPAPLPDCTEYAFKIPPGDPYPHLNLIIDHASKAMKRFGLSSTDDEDQTSAPPPRA